MMADHGVRARTGGAKRIVQIVHSAEPGGVQTMAAEIAAGLNQAGDRVETCYMFPDRRSGLFAKTLGALRAALHLARARPDAVIAYQAAGSILAGLVGRLVDCPIRIVHQTALPDEVKPLLRRLDRGLGSAGFYTANVVNSAATNAAFTDYPASYRRHLVRIDHGVVPPRAKFGRSETWARFGVPDDGPVLLNVGRLTGQKNQDVVIRALARLPRGRLVVAGAGPREDGVRRLAAESGMSARLHLLGDVPRGTIADLYAAADLFVFPSRWETFGLAAVEAALAGLPVVASDLAVLREVLQADTQTRVSFAGPDDVTAWETAIGAALGLRGTTVPAADLERLRRAHSPSRMLAAYRALLDRGGADMDSDRG